VATVDLAGAVLVVLLMAIPLLSGGLVVCNQCTNKAIRMIHPGRKQLGERQPHDGGYAKAQRR